MSITRKSKNNSRCDFDRWAKKYDEVVKKAYQDNDWMYKYYEEVLDQVVVFARDTLKKPEITVIDIGIGTGNLAQKIVGEAEYLIGIDPSV